MIEKYPFQESIQRVKQRLSNLDAKKANPVAEADRRAA